jgi:3-oxoadipate enol-lactonase
VNTYRVNGIQLVAVDRGRGVPLLLVHGFPLNHGMWKAQIDACSERCRVIAPDLRGFGDSSVTDGKVTMEQLADDLARLLDAMGVVEPVVYCGLSMGGYVGWEFWAKHRARVRAMILCDTRAGADTPEAAANRLATADRVLREGPGFLAEAMIPKLSSEVTLKRYPERIEALRRMIFSCDPRGIAAASRGMAERIDSTPRLSGIDCPTLVLVGEKDVISTVDEMRGMAQTIRGARFVTIRDAGHMSPMDNPAEVNAAVLSFLGEIK